MCLGQSNIETLSRSVSEGSVYSRAFNLRKLDVLAKGASYVTGKRVCTYLCSGVGDRSCTIYTDSDTRIP